MQHHLSLSLQLEHILLEDIVGEYALIGAIRTDDVACTIEVQDHEEYQSTDKSTDSIIYLNITSAGNPSI